jgi:hypothetical protein
VMNMMIQSELWSFCAVFPRSPYSFVCHEFLLRNEKAPKLLWRKRVKMSKQEIVVCCSFFPSQASKRVCKYEYIYIYIVLKLLIRDERFMRVMWDR